MALHLIGPCPECHHQLQQHSPEQTNGCGFTTQYRCAYPDCHCVQPGLAIWHASKRWPEPLPVELL